MGPYRSILRKHASSHCHITVSIHQACQICTVPLPMSCTTRELVADQTPVRRMLGVLQGIINGQQPDMRTVQKLHELIVSGNMSSDVSAKSLWYTICIVCLNHGCAVYVPCRNSAPCPSSNAAPKCNPCSTVAYLLHPPWSSHGLTVCM